MQYYIFMKFFYGTEFENSLVTRHQGQKGEKADILTFQLSFVEGL